MEIKKTEKEKEKKWMSNHKRMWGWHESSTIFNGQVTPKWFVVDFGSDWVCFSRHLGVPLLTISFLIFACVLRSW